MRFSMPTGVKDINEKLEIPEENWKKCVIYIRSCSIVAENEYEAQYTIKDNKVLFKPIKPYYSYEFEVLFGFGSGCINFSKDKIIEVSKPENYFEVYKEELNI